MMATATIDFGGRLRGMRRLRAACAVGNLLWPDRLARAVVQWGMHGVWFEPTLNGKPVGRADVNLVLRDDGTIEAEGLPA